MPHPGAGICIVVDDELLRSRPVEITRAIAYDPCLSPLARLLWGVLADRQCEDEPVRVGPANLAGELGVTEIAARRALRELVRRGLIRQHGDDAWILARRLHAYSRASALPLPGRE